MRGCDRCRWCSAGAGVVEVVCSDEAEHRRRVGRDVASSSCSSAAGAGGARPTRTRTIPETARTRLRRATETDVEAILDVQQEGAVLGLAHIFDQELYPFPRAVLAQRWRTEMASAEVDVHLWVNEGDAVLGFGAVEGSELLHFGTARSTWGSGVASAFHDALLATMGAPTTTLTLRVFEDNGRARRFYAKHGWRPTGASNPSTFPPYALLLAYEHRPAAG